jgi:hypothetical protein
LEGKKEEKLAEDSRNEFLRKVLPYNGRGELLL